VLGISSNYSTGIRQAARDPVECAVRTHFLRWIRGSNGMSDWRRQIKALKHINKPGTFVQDANRMKVIIKVATKYGCFVRFNKLSKIATCLM
jgi:predicted secreted protein